MGQRGPFGVTTPLEPVFPRAPAPPQQQIPVCSLSPADACLMPPAFGAILQGSLFGLAGLLPASYTAPIMSGQGLAGFFASVAMICAIASKCCRLSVCLPACGSGHGGGGGDRGQSPLSHMLPTGGSELSESAFGYFITACVVIVLAIICYLALPRLVSR